MIDLSRYENRLSLGNKLARLCWNWTWLLLFRPSPRFCFGWRRFLLRLFGARIGKSAYVYPSSRIFAPWNLEIGEYSCLSFGVECYSVDKVSVGSHATVSQYAFLCTASHDIADPQMALTTAPIRIENQAWVAARAYIGPGVTVGEGAVCGACAVVAKDVAPWTVVAGNPAKIIKKRKIRESL